jgi:VWFA-related protein
VGCVLAALTPGLYSESQTPVFRTGATRVSLDVIVTDRDGRPVSGLTADDFEIEEAGRLQRVTTADHVSVPLATRTIDLKAAPPVATDVVDNTPPSRDSRAFVFVIDDGAVSPLSIVHVKDIMATVLGTMGAQDRAAVVFIRRSDLAQDFTSDFGRLVSAVNRASVAIGWTPDLRATMIVLENALTVLRAAPQTRRAIIYISGGFEVTLAPDTRNADGSVRAQGSPFKDSLTRDRLASLDLVALFDRARHAGVPIYAIDPSTVSPARFTGDLARRGALRREFLHTVALATGGRAFTGATSRDTLRNMGRAIMADNADYYVLTFEPDPYVGDDRFHSVTVRVKGRRDLTVRARPGYLASPAFATLTTQEAVVQALEAAQPGGDLPLRAVAAVTSPAEHGARVQLAVDVVMSDVSSTGGDTLVLATAVVDTDGGVKSTSTSEIPVRETDGAMPSTVTLRPVVDVPSGLSTIRLSVTSRALQRHGVVHIPVDAPDFDRDLALSSLMLGGAELSTVRTFAADEPLLVHARAFGKRAAGATAALTIAGGGSVLRTIPVSPIPDPTVPSAVALNAAVPLSGLPPGAYELVLTASAKSAKPVVRRVAITVK